LPVNQEKYLLLKKELDAGNVTLVAVSKTQSVDSIRALYDLGQRDFGENYVRELLAKKEQLPSDINWHFIGHLQTNKVRQITGAVQLIQGVDSLKLLQEIEKQAAKRGVVQDCLLQVHIAREETKFGFSEAELRQVVETGGSGFPHVRLRGLMGMASLTADETAIRKEFKYLQDLFHQVRSRSGEQFDILSMGMSSDYRIALECGSTMVRIGSLLFGDRR
jgi:pyridoxal phosphate enzyme (YggS family)